MEHLFYFLIFVSMIIQVFVLMDKKNIVSFFEKTRKLIKEKNK